jgi:putative endonuclease
MRRPLAVSILANTRRTVLYVGVTGDLARRLHQHRTGTGSQFARRYHADRLVYVALFENPLDAIACEKQLKAGSRQRKVELIERANPDWLDLSEV